MTIELTELEHCVIAEIRRLEPCSAYAVRQVFVRSPTPAWSGSSGAIYPIVKRLLAHGLIRAEAKEGDARGRRDLYVTSEGLSATRVWINDLEGYLERPTPDPIRTRLKYLDQLVSDAERIRFVREAMDVTNDAVAALEKIVEPEGHTGFFERKVMLGALFELKARGRWLAEVLADLLDPCAVTSHAQVRPKKT